MIFLRIYDCKLCVNKPFPSRSIHNSTQNAYKIYTILVAMWTNLRLNMPFKTNLASFHPLPL